MSERLISLSYNSLRNILCLPQYLSQLAYCPLSDVSTPLESDKELPHLHKDIHEIFLRNEMINEIDSTQTNLILQTKEEFQSLSFELMKKKRKKMKEMMRIKRRRTEAKMKKMIAFPIHLKDLRI